MEVVWKCHRQKMRWINSNELGVNLKRGYNGDLTSREAGSVGGEMVRQMIRKQEEQMSGQQ